jgi:hypothetical protein
MFINGIKLFVVSIIYFLIPTIVFMVAGGAGIMMGGAADSLGAGALIGMLIGMIFLFVFSLIALMGLVRFARTDSFGEAFNFSAIITHIGEIGWVSYVLALVIFWIVAAVAAVIFAIAMGVISAILLLIPFVGWLLAFLLSIIIAVLIGPFVGVFGTRYITHIYDSAPQTLDRGRYRLWGGGKKPPPLCLSGLNMQYPLLGAEWRKTAKSAKRGKNTPKRSPECTIDYEH